MRCSILGETNLAVLITDSSQNLEANQSAHFMERDLILVDAERFNADASSAFTKGRFVNPFSLSFLAMEHPE